MKIILIAVTFFASHSYAKNLDTIFCKNTECNYGKYGFTVCTKEYSDGEVEKVEGNEAFELYLNLNAAVIEVDDHLAGCTLNSNTTTKTEEL